MALPSTLKNFNLFIDAENFAGVAEEVKLPKLGRKTEDFRGGGMNGPAAIDLGQEKLEIEFDAGGFVIQAFKAYAAAKHNAVLLRFAGAYQRDDTAEVSAVEVVCRGRYNEIDPGGAKAGDKTKQGHKLALTYYKLVVNNETVIEIDIVNFIEIVNGVDVLQEQRKAIGLA